MLTAGALNRRVTIKSQSASQDSAGQLVRTWSDVVTVWASIRHLSGVETLKADVTVSAVRASIRIRYRTGITAGMAVHHGSTVYDIEAVLPDDVRREFVDLLCVQGVNDG